MVDQHALEIVFLVSKTLGGAAILLHLQYQTFCPCNQLELAKSLYLYHGHSDCQSRSNWRVLTKVSQNWEDTKH